MTKYNTKLAEWRPFLKKKLNFKTQIGIYLGNGYRDRTKLKRLKIVQLERVNLKLFMLKLCLLTYVFAYLRYTFCVLGRRCGLHVLYRERRSQNPHQTKGTFQNGRHTILYTF